MFGKYQPAAIAQMLNAQAGLPLLMPDKMSTAMSTMGYAVPSGVNLAGIPQEAMLALVATADQSGLGRGRAGARLKDFIETLGVTQSRQREKAKTKLGLAGPIDANGSVDLMKSFQILQADAERLGPQAYRDLVRTAFGAQGSVVAAMFGDDQKRKMFAANQQVISESVQHGDLTTIQNLLKDTPLGQVILLLTLSDADVGERVVDYEQEEILSTY